MTTNPAMQLIVSGTSTVLVESSGDGESWQNVSDPATGYTASTIVILDHRVTYYRATVFGYTSGTVTAIVGPGFGRNNELMLPTPGPRGDELEEDVAQNQARVLYSSIGDSAAIANTTTETAFSKTYTLTAGKVNQTGVAVRVTAGGKVSATGVVNLTLRLRIGGTTIADAIQSAIATMTDDSWTAQGVFVVRSTGSGASVASGGMNMLFLGGSVPPGTKDYIAPITKDLTAAQVIDWTAQWSAAAAGDSITMTSFVVETLTPETTS